METEITLLEKVMKRKNNSLDFHLRRTRRKNLPSTLTQEQWIETRKYFHGLCAYCQLRPATYKDHFIPVVHGGGTTWDNIVPSCAKCEKKKAGSMPDEVWGISQMDIERVKSYLATRKGETRS